MLDGGGDTFGVIRVGARLGVHTLAPTISNIENTFVDPKYLPPLVKVPILISFGKSQSIHLLTLGEERLPFSFHRSVSQSVMNHLAYCPDRGLSH